MDSKNTEISEQNADIEHAKSASGHEYDSMVDAISELHTITEMNVPKAINPDME